MSWTKVGQIGVDAGLCWLGDPCYTVSKDASNVWESWEKFCDDLRKKDKANGGYLSTYDFGFRGVAVSTGHGDGSYPVYVKKDSDGVVMEARVVFIDEDSEDEEW